jgi:membrane fusion protein (multidrug efflux system)
VSRWRWTSVAGIGLALGLGACGRASEAEHVAEAPPAPEQARPEAIVVTVSPAAVRSVERTVSVVGTLDANQQADLASETEGQVMAVRGDLGDRVVRGQVLLEVRSDVIEAQLEEAEASLEKAVADEARAAPLRAQGIIAQQEYEKVRTELRVAQARRDRLRIEHERAHVRAPFDGSVSARLTNLGDYVRPGTVVFRLVQDDPLTFRGEVPERDVPSLKPGQAMRVTVDPYPGEAFSGTVTRVGAASDPAARSLAFEAAVPNHDRRLLPGFFGHGEVVVRREERAVAVPRAAVTTFAGVTKVFVVEDGVARERAVTLGVDLGDGWVEVAQGVSRGMPVVTSGLSRLADGTPVTVREDATPSA